MLKHVYKQELGKNIYLEPSDERISEGEELYCALCGYRVEIEETDEGRNFKHVPENESCPDVEDCEDTTIKDGLPEIAIENINNKYGLSEDSETENIGELVERGDEADICESEADTNVVAESRTEENVLEILSALTPQQDNVTNPVDHQDSDTDFFKDIAEIESRRTQPITMETAKDYLEAAGVKLSAEQTNASRADWENSESQLIENADTIAEIKAPNSVVDQSNSDVKYVVGIAVVSFLIVICGAILLYLKLFDNSEPVIRKTSNDIVVNSDQGVDQYQLEDLPESIDYSNLQDDESNEVVAQETVITEKLDSGSDAASAQEVAVEGDVSEDQKIEIVSELANNSNSELIADKSTQTEVVDNVEQSSADREVNESSKDETGASSANATNERCVKLTGTSIKFREYPEPSAAVLATLPEDLETICYEPDSPQGNWLKVNYNNKIGYICECSTSHSSPLPAKAVALEKIAAYEYPSFGSKKHTNYVKKGAVVQILSEKNCWYEFRTSNGFGYRGEKRRVHGYGNKCYYKPVE